MALLFPSILFGQNYLYSFEKLYTPHSANIHPASGYLHIYEDMAVIHGNSRGVDYFIYGEVRNFKKKMKSEKFFTSFYVQGQKVSLGKVSSFEIFENDEGQIIVHFFKKLGDLDVFFIAKQHDTSEITSLLFED